MVEATIWYKNFNDNDVLDSLPTEYDSLIVPGKMVAHSSNSLPARLEQLRSDHGIEYYIDPTLPDFRIGDNFRDNGRIKEWHWKYINELDPLVKSIITNDGNLNASQISGSDRDQIVRSAIRFQEEAIPNAIDGGATSKYTETDDKSAYQPNAVVPWYHKIQSSADIDINDEILQTATDEAQLAVKPCLFVTQNYVRQISNQRDLVNLLRNNGIEQCFVWIEALDKKEVSEPLYERVIQFIKALSENGISPHFYYSDYFATLLTYFGADGISYGTLHSENASEKEEGTSGGGSLPRYYINQIKDFLKVPAAAELQQRTSASMCDCAVCTPEFISWTNLANLANNDENILTPLKKHHVITRQRQVQEVDSKPMADVIEECEDAFDNYRADYAASNQISPSKSLEYMPRWLTAVENQS